MCMSSCVCVFMSARPPSVGDGGTGRRVRQWEAGQSVEGLDPSIGKRPGPRTLMLRSIRSPLAKTWNMTRQVSWALWRAGEKGGWADERAGGRASGLQCRR